MFLYADDMMRFAFSQPLDEDDYEPGFAIMGAGFDSTTTYKVGSRYGPKAIREASYNFESYNLSFDTVLDTNVYDIGDIQVVHGNFKKTDTMIQDTVYSVLEMGLRPIVMGGEHTISQSVLKAIKEYDKELFDNLTIIHFDAHFDMRDTYQDEKYSHATVLRRIHELNPKEIIQIGIRSGNYEEYNYVKHHKDISAYTSMELYLDPEELCQELDSLYGPVYITVDIDVLDPAYAPSVGTPSPCGLSPFDLENMIYVLSQMDVVGLDVVEVSSDKIGDVTSINASKVIYDFLCLQE